MQNLHWTKKHVCSTLYIFTGVIYMRVKPKFHKCETLVKSKLQTRFNFKKIDKESTSQWIQAEINFLSFFYDINRKRLSHGWFPWMRDLKFRWDFDYFFWSWLMILWKPTDKMLVVFNEMVSINSPHTCTSLSLCVELILQGVTLCHGLRQLNITQAACSEQLSDQYNMHILLVI